MNRFFFAVTAGFLVAATASADTPPVSGPAGSTAPAVGSTIPTPVVQNTLIQPPQRMGLFARMRARRTNPMLSTGVAYPATTAVPVPTSTPMPMPTTPPATTPPATVKGSTSNAMPSVTGMPVVVGTSPEVMSSTTTTRRMGLIARLRMRRS